MQLDHAQHTFNIAWRGHTILFSPLDLVWLLITHAVQVCNGWTGRDPVTRVLQENRTLWPGGMKALAAYLRAKQPPIKLGCYTARKSAPFVQRFSSFLASDASGTCMA